MELFTQLFGNLLVFVYHCFDRIVIHGYLSGLSRPEQVVHFFRQVLGIPVVSKEVLSQRTNDYQNWVEAFARNHRIPMEWAEKGVRKEDHVLPALAPHGEDAMLTASTSSSRAWNKAAPSGSACRSIPRRIPTTASWRTSGAASPITTSISGTRCWDRSSSAWPAFFPFHATYWLNGHSFIERELKRAGIGFRKNDNAFLAVDDVAALQAAADRLSSADHPQTTRLLDPHPGAEVLQEGTQPDEPVALLRHRPDRVLPQFHLQTPLSHPQDLRAQLRNRPVAADGEPHQRDLRRAAEQDGCAANSPPSSTRSSMAIMSSAPTGRTPSSNSTRSSPASCATNSAPTTCATSA